FSVPSLPATTTPAPPLWCIRRASQRCVETQISSGEIPSIRPLGRTYRHNSVVTMQYQLSRRARAEFKESVREYRKESCKKREPENAKQPAIPGLAASITNCAFEHHILGGRRYVSKKRPIYSSRAHYGCPGLPPRPGNLFGDPGGQCERRPHVRSKV